MKHVENNLEDWLKNSNGKHLPGRKKNTHYQKYKSIKDYLEKNVYKDINSYANFVDGGYLNDHGIDHIDSVIWKASEILNYEKSALSPYEIYLLLLSALFHDVGHIENGREQHEKTAAIFIEHINPHMNDKTELNLIKKIIDAHGGESSKSRDKISLLERETCINSFEVRIQLLAAILRLADELSDDRTRASQYLLHRDKIPKSSQVYHHYSDSLHSVNIKPEEKSISLLFEINIDTATKKMGKGNSEIYLLDEIYIRTLKTFQECLYCMRFIPIEKQLKEIKVKIEFYDDKNSEDLQNEKNNFLEPIKYTLKESGYPDLSPSDIFQMCPNELRRGNENLSGEKLKELIEKGRSK